MCVVVCQGVEWGVQHAVASSLVTRGSAGRVAKPRSYIAARNGLAWPRAAARSPLRRPWVAATTQRTCCSWWCGDSAGFGNGGQQAKVMLWRSAAWIAWRRTIAASPLAGCTSTAFLTFHNTNSCAQAFSPPPISHITIPSTRHQLSTLQQLVCEGGAVAAEHFLAARCCWRQPPIIMQQQLGSQLAAAS